MLALQRCCGKTATALRPYPGGVLGSPLPNATSTPDALLSFRLYPFTVNVVFTFCLAYSQSKRLCRLRGFVACLCWGGEQQEQPQPCTLYALLSTLTRRTSPSQTPTSNSAFSIIHYTQLHSRRSGTFVPPFAFLSPLLVLLPSPTTLAVLSLSSSPLSRPPTPNPPSTTQPSETKSCVE